MPRHILELDRGGPIDAAEILEDCRLLGLEGAVVVVIRSVAWGRGNRWDIQLKIRTVFLRIWSEFE
jgi:hypothetical protein